MGKLFCSRSLRVVRRFKLAAFLSILGLSVAFATFMIIMIQLDYDYSFDKFHENGDQIFRLEISSSADICRPVAKRFFESSPHIIAGAFTSSGEENVFSMWRRIMRGISIWENH